MEELKKLGITPEEFINGFQYYLRSLPVGVIIGGAGNNEDNKVDLLPSGKTVLKINSSLTVGDSKTESHFENYINLLIIQKRDSKLDDLLDLFIKD